MTQGHYTAIEDFLSELSLPEVSINGAATLGASAFGRMHVCTDMGTPADYTVGLPAVANNAGKFIGLRMAPGLTKLVTLDGNAAETIDGATTRVMWAQESAVLLCDGSTWTKIAGKSRGLYCLMGRIAGVTIPTATVTKIALSPVIAENFPQGNTTTFGIDIKRTGNYQISFQVKNGASAFAGPIHAHTYKNGSSLLFTGVAAMPAYDVAGRIGTRPLVAGDFLELYCAQFEGADRDLDTGGSDYNSIEINESVDW